VKLTQAGPPFGNGQPALSAWVSFTNAHGGLAGHPIKLDSKDDTADTNKALQNIQNCVENEHSVAIVAAFVPLAADSIAPYLQGQKVPMIGGDGLTDVWYSNPYLFPTGAAPQGTANGAVRAWKLSNKSNPAIVYCAETVSCPNAQKLVSAAAAAAGIPVKNNYQTSLANPSFTSQCSSMKSAGTDVLYIALDGPSIQRLARDCNGIGFHPLYTTGALALDANAVVDDPNLEGITVADVVASWVTSITPAEKDFQTAMATYAPDIVPSESAAISWASGQMLAKAVANLGDSARTKPITSAMILQGLAMFKNETLGGLFPGPLTFTAGKASPRLTCWALTTLTGGKWTALQGGAGACP
jgi:branched-chain amino acid transport system substrate-binding protein